MDIPAKTLQRKLRILCEHLEKPPVDEQQARQLKQELKEVIEDIHLISSTLDERT